MTFNLAIVNGYVIDGAGNPAFKSNIYVKDGKISKINRSELGEADVVIDAKGLIVSPGFIDIHNHSDHTIFAGPKCESYIHQGVTTVVVGNCGLSVAPISTEYKREIIRYLEAFTLGTKIPYNWRSFGEYLDRLEEKELGINFYPMIGDCAIRAAVMGFEAKKASDSELEEMKYLMEDAVMEGCPSMSSGWYAPGYWTETEELIELAKIMSRAGGVYHTHMRKKGFAEAVEIGKRADIPVEIVHYNGKGIIEARASGVDVTYNAYPYHAGSSLLGQLLPVWTYDRGTDSMLDRIKDSETREKIKEEITNRWGIPRRIAYLPNKKSKQYEGRYIQEIAESEGVEPAELLCDLLLDNDGNGMYITMNGRNEAYIFKTLRDPNQHIMSDGWGLAPYGPLHVGKPHPRCYGTFPRVLGWYVRECETISLQEAIRKMTSAPAQRIGVKDRGLLREGMWADITVFDPKKVIDKATFDEPHQYPLGIEYVLVNGHLVIEKSEHTDKLAGKVLRRKK